MFKKNFLFIILISIVTLVILIVGSLTLYQDNSLSFDSDGYIIETNTNTKTNTKYYFSANTKYKENVEEKITFEDKDSNKVSVDPASFVHYENGNVSFLKKGALVNLNDITSPMVSYYNITNENTITYEQEHYTVTTNNKKINIDSFVGRISDSKYLIAGKNLSLKIPTENDRIYGDFFEINYIEEGIIKIDNNENSYQVTAQDSYIYVGDNITINLGDGKIFYDGDAKMLLSQITINGDENINLDVEENKNGGSGGGSGEGTGEGTGNDTDGTGDANEPGSGENAGDGTGEGTTGNGESTGEGNGDGANGSTGDGTGTGEGGLAGDNSTASPQVELIEAIVTSTTIDLTMQLNNANLAKGNVVAYLTNVANGNKENPIRIDLNNGTFKLPYASLLPDTTYALTIIETDIESEKQYFQKTFRTKQLGLNLEKTYATSDTLSYNLTFDENTEVTKAHITIYDNNGSNEDIIVNEYTISASDLNNSATFTGLKSNTSYSINVDTVWINNTEYSNVYTINRIDTTLKETPKISGVKVAADAEEVKFTIELGSVLDKDKSIISYTYNVYLADDITLENLNPEIKYSVTKNDSDPLVLNLNEINELKTGVDYRCKIIARYNDNEMIREVTTDYSGNFLIKSKPKIAFELKSATMNKVQGTITLLDANCTVPMKGRSCSNRDNELKLRYYELSTEETNENDTTLSFDTRKLTSNITLSNLKSNTTYVLKVFGDYIDDDNNLHDYVQIGDTFYVSTDKSENIYFEVAGDNVSGGKSEDGSDIIVSFDAKLSAPQDSKIMDEISTITFNLYSGRYNTKDKLIGTYQITDRTSIVDLFSNATITNYLFEDVTENKVGKIDTLAKLIKLTNNLSGTLNGSYTVEVEDVYDSTGKNKITIENNIYTFNLTPSYYLDSRIISNPNENYVTVTPITIEQLKADKEEYDRVNKEVKNLDELNETTIVGINLENSLSDIFVNSAYTYEKAIVNYTICNDTLRDCDEILSKLTDDNSDNDEDAKKEIKIISVGMGNIYQPKIQTIYLDSSTYKDAKKWFIRGYDYKIGYYISFIQEDGATPIYNNEKLHRTISIEKQSPIYTQYISKSTSTDITYNYNFRDVDSVLADKNFYYTLGEDKNNYNKVTDSLIADGKTNSVTIPINEKNLYTLYYAKKNTKDKVEYVEITTNEFESEYNYEDTPERIDYTISKQKDNILRIKLESNDITNRAIAFKVVINTKDKTNIPQYTKYFLASKLETFSENTGILDETGNNITNDYKCITIDYASIVRFMGYEINVEVSSYYDSGLVGYNQPFNNGLILKDRVNNKYLNIYNNETTDDSSVSKEEINMGLYMLKEPYNEEQGIISIYNYLVNTKQYNPLFGASYYATDVSKYSNIGIEFTATPTKSGMTLTNNKDNYELLDAKALKVATLSTNDNTYLFESIVPMIEVITSNKNNTINSVTININPSGIYGREQFKKDNKIHEFATIELYSSSDCNPDSLVAKKETKINISEKGDSATINPVTFENLKPQTTYYFKVYAYLKNEYVQLYDSSSSLTYITRIYNVSTLTARGIIESIKFSVNPFAYNGESSKKELIWRLGLKNTQNYKIRFELYKPTGTTKTTINEETGEEIIEPIYELVNFNGSSICEDNPNPSQNGYVDNCYISVDKDDIASINGVEQKYHFTGDELVFGGNYYKLLVYAIPYTNEQYREDDKVTLYQDNSLTTTPIKDVNGVSVNIDIEPLEEASFSFEADSLTSGYNKENGYYISLKPTVKDNDNVIKYGHYSVTLMNNERKEIATKEEQKSGIGEANSEILFTGLTSNTLYYVELNYKTYRNNYGYSTSEKTATTPFTDFIYTPINDNITLGTITASQTTSNKSVTLTYNGASGNISSEIIRVSYTISLKGGSSKTTGDFITYTGNYDGEILEKNTENIFSILSASNKVPKLTIDISDDIHSSNTGFKFQSNNTYIITTQYWYLNDEGIPELLTAQDITSNPTYTTILNL